ncbi:maleylpyruvate isomerase N-terminal domain-containing protein [Rhodococcus aerolatus]
MSGLQIDHGTGRDAFVAQLERFQEAVEALDDRQLLTASRCHGWTALEVLVHVRTGLQEMVGGAVSPTTATPDRDAASYWGAFAPGASSSGAKVDDVPAILWTRRTASAYGRPRGALEHLGMAAETAAAAVRAMSEAPVAFQGHVLRSGDFLATWAVELAVHHLDLGPDLDVTPPVPGALRLARRTVEALHGTALPASWTDERCVLLGTGRSTPTAAEAAEAGTGSLGRPRLTTPHGPHTARSVAPDGP